MLPNLLAPLLGSSSLECCYSSLFAFMLQPQVNLQQKSLIYWTVCITTLNVIFSLILLIKCSAGNSKNPFRA